jgi:biopolymer transport protein TolR
LALFGEYNRNLFFCVEDGPMKTAEVVLLQSWRRQAKLFSDFNTLPFACVMSIVMFVLLFVFLTNGGPTCRGITTDLPKVDHPVPMPGADREDAMIVNVTRDGKVYFAADQIMPANLAQKIADRMNDHSVERKVYIRVDMRTRWGMVRQVLDGVHFAGVMRVGFLVDERRSAAFHM